MNDYDTIADIVNAAAAVMADENNALIEECRVRILYFLNIGDEAQLYHVKPKAPGEASTIALRHVIRNGCKIEVLDVVEAFGNIGAVAASILAGEPVALGVAITQAGLYFIRAFRKATTVDLQPADAAIIWALRELGGEAAPDDLRAKWSSVMSAADLDGDTRAERLNARLASLVELGCVKVDGESVAFAEQVEREY